MTGAWGLGAWGLGPWGSVGGGVGTLAMANAVAISTNVVRVTFDQAPLAVSSLLDGDALNPESWVVTRADNGQTFTVLSVQADGPLVFDVLVLEKFGSWLLPHVVATPDLVDPLGNPIGSPDSATFAGVEAAVKPYLDAGVTDFDLANPQAPTTGFPGTLRTTAGGDYATEAGAAFVEKLVLRAITTAVGAFFHLPGYGYSLGLKLPVTPSKLGALKKGLNDLVEAIPQVSAADTLVSFDNASGVTTVTVNAQLRSTGQTIQVVDRFASNGVQL